MTVAGKWAIAVACLAVCVSIIGFAQGSDGKTWDDAVRLFSEALAAHQAGSLWDAVGLYEKALVIVRELEQRAAESAILNNLGNCYASLSSYEQAIDYHEQALTIFVDIGDRAGEASCLNSLGSCHFTLSDYGQALDYYEQALAIFIEIGDRVSEAACWNNLGNCYASLSDYAQAIDVYEQSLAIEREIGNRVGEAGCLNNLGSCSWASSDYEGATDYFKQALAICVDIGDRASEATCLNNLGNCHYSLSEYGRAIDLYERSLVVRRAIDDRLGEAASLSNLGNCYSSLCDYGRAIEHHERTLATCVEIGDRAGEARSLGNLGSCYYGLSDYTRAIDYHEQSQAVFVAIGDRADEAACLNNLGVCYWALSDCTLAIDYFEPALAIKREIGDRAGEARGLNNLASCYESLSDYGRAIDLYEQSLALAVDLGSKELERYVQWGLGHTYRAIEQLQTASQHYEAAITIVESIRGSVDEEVLRQSYLESVRTMYEEYLALLLKLGRSDETFLVAERLRARTFLDDLYQAGLTPEQLQLDEAGIDRTRDETKPVMDFAALTVAVGDGRESLMPSEAVLEYMVTEDGIYLWVITAGAVSSPTFLPYPRQQLIEDVRALRDAIETTEPDFIVQHGMLGSLYAALVAPGLAQLGEGIDTLVFIPSGPLWYVPFAALPLRGQRDERGNVPRMVERYTVAYLPSLASLTSLAGDEEQTVSRGVIALANPTLSPEQLEALGMTSREYLHREVERAVRDFAASYSGEQDVVYTRSDAEEPRAYELEGAFDVAIYVCHGMFNPYFPLQSKLLLAPGRAVTTTVDDTRDSADGDYHAWEALLTNHRGVGLVVLAACETLLPSFRNLQDTLGTLSGTDPREVKLTREQLEQLVVGDEVVGLARAFLSSGAQSVLGTLWQANPKAVTALLVSMCKHYRAGLTWAQALCAAQRELIPVYANIWSWAPYQLIGRWR